MIDGTEESETFIYLPAKLSDNPNEAFRKNYEKKLSALPSHMRQALRDGDWFVTAGSFYAEYWNKQMHVCRPFRVPRTWRFFRSMDWGFKSPGCIHWWALDHDGTMYCIKELTFRGQTDAQVAAMVKEIEVEMGLWKNGHSLITGPADTQLWEDRGNSGKTKAQVFVEAGVPWAKANKKSRRANAQQVIKRLTDHGYGTKTPGLVVFETCLKLLHTMPAVQTSINDPETPMDTSDDHWHDSALYACAYAAAGTVGAPGRYEDDPDDDDDKDDDHDSERRGRDGYGAGY
jgi:hypothetical protein